MYMNAKCPTPVPVSCAENETRTDSVRSASCCSEDRIGCRFVGREILDVNTLSHLRADPAKKYRRPHANKSVFFALSDTGGIGVKSQSRCWRDETCKS